MTAAVRAGLCYFAGVLALGFLLGVVRILWLVPRLGAQILHAFFPLLRISLGRKTG